MRSHLSQETKNPVSCFFSAKAADIFKLLNIKEQVEIVYILHIYDSAPKSFMHKSFRPVLCFF